MRPEEDRSRRLGQPTAPADPTSATEVATSLADHADGADPREVGELLTTIGIKLDEVDDLVHDARSRVDAIPDQRTLWALFGEALVRLHAVELEVAGLRAEVAQLRQRGRAA